MRFEGKVQDVRFLGVFLQRSCRRKGRVDPDLLSLGIIVPLMGGKALSGNPVSYAIIHQHSFQILKLLWL